MIIKNQHLLMALVVLGVLQLLSLGCLKQATSGVESRLKEEINGSRNDTAVLVRDAVNLKQQLKDALGQIEQTQSDLRDTQNQLNRTRMELDKLKAAAARDAAGGEERKP